MAMSPESIPVTFNLQPGQLQILPPSDWDQLPEIVRHAVTLAQHANGMSYFDAISLLKDAMDTPVNVRRLEREKTAFAETVHDLRRENQKLARHLLTAKVALDRVQVALRDTASPVGSVFNELRSIFDDPELREFTQSLEDLI